MINITHNIPIKQYPPSLSSSTPLHSSLLQPSQSVSNTYVTTRSTSQFAQWIPSIVYGIIPPPLGSKLYVRNFDLLSTTSLSTVCSSIEPQIGASGKRIPIVSTWNPEQWPSGRLVYRKDDRYNRLNKETKQPVNQNLLPQLGLILETKFVIKDAERPPGRLRCYVQWDGRDHAQECLPNSLFLVASMQELKLYSTNKDTTTSRPYNTSSTNNTIESKNTKHSMKNEYQEVGNDDEYYRCSHQRPLPVVLARPIQHVQQQASTYSPSSSTNTSGSSTFSSATTPTTSTIDLTFPIDIYQPIRILLEACDVDEQTLKKFDNEGFKTVAHAFMLRGNESEIRTLIPMMLPRLKFCKYLNDHCH